MIVFLRALRKSRESSALPNPQPPRTTLPVGPRPSLIPALAATARDSASNTSTLRTSAAKRGDPPVRCCCFRGGRWQRHLIATAELSCPRGCRGGRPCRPRECVHDGHETARRTPGAPAGHKTTPECPARWPDPHAIDQTVWSTPHRPQQRFQKTRDHHHDRRLLSCCFVPCSPVAAARETPAGSYRASSAATKPHHHHHRQQTTHLSHAD